MPPRIDRNPATGVARPPGVVPKNVQRYVLGGIALLVIAASTYSGRRVPTAEGPKTPPSPTASQLKNFQQLLEQRRRETEEVQKRLDEARLKEDKAPERPVNSGPSTRDEEDARRRARAAAAPFASSLAFRSPEPADPPALNVTSQIAVRVENAPPAESRATKDAEPGEAPAKESGQLLRAKEGDLYRVYEGTTIKTVLFNRLDGSFTGPVLTKVTEDVRSKDKAALLIPKNSLFIGQATRVEAQHQTRLAVAFSRLLMPNGYSVNLESAPALDPSGETGLKDKVNNHRLRSFGVSGAIGLLGGLALYGTQAIPFAQGVANTTGRAAINTLNQFLNAVPTITIREGHQVVVYLPQDLLLPEFHP